MGYTHYWKVPEWDEADQAGFLTALPLIKAVLEKYSAIVCEEYSKPTSPAIVTEEQIWFNGKGDDGHETFVFQPGVHEFGFCKTAYKPYDVPVCAVLLLLQEHIPHLQLSSDGFSANLPTDGTDPQVEEGWQRAIEEVQALGFPQAVVIVNRRPPYCDLTITRAVTEGGSDNGQS